jgi:hypothetical protein
MKMQIRMIRMASICADILLVTVTETKNYQSLGTSMLRTSSSPSEKCVT